MCGIFGAVGVLDLAKLRQAALTLGHRGPDGFHDWQSEDHSTYLAHCRLKIIDLSDAGRQPMTNEDGSVVLSFNGEIYNFVELRTELERRGHRFKSRTDSEVIVHGYEEWGREVVSRLRGMFAFAIWDARRAHVMLARDHLGVKPLYYLLRGRQLVFGSETRALLPFLTALEPDPDSLRSFLVDGYITGPQSVWKGVNRLSPATCLTFDVHKSTLCMEQYWAPVFEPTAITADDALVSFEHLMDDAVREQLTSDVPVGVFLSGGVDSSLVAASAARANNSIDSFFIDFTGWQGSERDDASAAALHLGTRHHVECIGLQPLSDETVDGVFQAFDEPIGDPAIVPSWYLSGVMRRHVGVALSGDGGDEIFGGYTRYRQVGASPRRRLAWTLERTRRRFGIGKPWPQRCANQSEYYRWLQCSLFSESELRLLMPVWESHDVNDTALSALIGEHSTTPKGQRYWQSVDMGSYLVDNNLARMDRASMAHGLEVRVPFLDPRIVEFAMSLPDELIDARAGGKPLLRRAVRNQLPPRLHSKPKQGFSFPIGLIVKSEVIVARLREGALVRSGLVDRSGLDRWLEQNRTAGSDYKLWLLYALDHWADQWWISR